MEKEKKKQVAFYDATDLMQILGISLSHSYKIMRQLNQELKEHGYMTITGKVPKRYFEERWYGYKQ